MPQYPDWTARDLITHTAMIHGRTTAICETLPRDRISAPRLSEGDDAFAWYEANLAAMLDALGQADLSTPVWTLTSDGTVGFWLKRMAVETAIHRWDIEDAFGESHPLDTDVSRMALDEFGEMWMPHLGDLPALQAHAVDLDNAWVFGEGEISDSVEGTASAIYLRLMSRGSLVLPDRWANAVDNVGAARKP